MNKFREKLALPFDGLRTETLDELETVCKDVSIAFSVFCAENCNYDDGWWNRNWKDEAFTTEELFNIFLEQYEG